MPLDRTWYDTLVNDDGSNTTGTLWNKAAVDSLLDSIDTYLADAVEGAWVDYSGTSTIVGWSSRTTTFLKYKKIGKMVFVKYTFSGTSNSTNLTFTLPYTNADNSSLGGVAPVGLAVDNGALITQTKSVSLQMQASSATARILVDNAVGWTASGTKTAEGQFWYQSTT